MSYNKAVELSDPGEENSIKDDATKIAGKFQLATIQNGFRKPPNSKAGSSQSHLSKKNELHKATEKGLLNVVKSVIIDDGFLIDSLDEEGFCALHVAAMHNRTQMVTFLLDSGAYFEALSVPDGLTPLHLACRYNCIEVARILLDRGADPNHPSPLGVTPLHNCARFNSSEVLRLLLSKTDIDLEITNQTKSTPLHVACAYGCLGTAEILVASGARIDACAVEGIDILHLAVLGGNIQVLSTIINSAIQRYIKSPATVFVPPTTNTKFHSFINAKTDSGESALHVAVKCGFYEQTKLLIQHHALVNDVTNSNQTPLHFAAMCAGGETVAMLLSKQAKVDFQDERMKTPLHYAASFGNKEAIKHLWDCGAAVDTKDVTNMTPLLCAVTAGYNECVCLLVEYGADVLAVDNQGRSCLHLAVESEHEELVASLLEKKAGRELLNRYEPKKERTPIHYAAVTGNVKIMDLLLCSKPNCALKDVNKKTPLHIAVESGKSRTVEMLAQSGMTAVFDRDDMLRTPLHYAAMYKRKKLCATLLRFGAEIDCLDVNRWTPVTWAVKSGDVETTSFLLEREAQLSFTDSKGNTLLHVACISGHVDVARLLLDNGIEITLNDSHMTCLDCAVEQQNSDVVMAIIKHSRWEDVLRVQSTQNPMTALIQYFPDAAHVAMDRCVQRSHTLQGKSTQMVTTYNFRYLDPGPADCSGPGGERYIGLADMVKFKRQDLLTHPLARRLLSSKWRTFGRTLYALNFLLYVVFLLGLTIFITTQRAGMRIKHKHVHAHNNETEEDNLFYEFRTNFNRYMAWIVLVFSVFHILKEIYQVYTLRARYFMDAGNLLEWCLYATAFIFVSPFIFANDWLHTKLRITWQIGTVSVFLGFTNLILFLRVLSHVGLFVTMYLEVVKTLFKVLSLFLIFILNFAILFFILFKEESAFEDIFKSVVKTTVMTIGELDYATLLVDGLAATNAGTGGAQVPFPDLSFICFYIFLLAMPIVLMNLLIGLAVGDIDAIQQTAFLTNKKMKIDFVSDVEMKYPRCVINRLYKPEMTVCHTRRKFKKLFSSTDIQLMEDEDTGDSDIREDPTTVQFREVKQELSKARQQIKSMSARMDKQQDILIALARKNGISVGESSVTETRRYNKRM